MLRRLASVVVCAALAACVSAPAPSHESTPIVEPGGATQAPDVGEGAAWVIAVHGGAGVKGRDAMTPELEAEYRATLTAALEAGGGVLARGGDGPAAVEAAIMVLEDSPLFNAGRGAALDEHGDARHDASMMRGQDHDAGAIAGSSRIRNPITAARAVMERTDNVLLQGEGADWFAAEEGLTLAEPLYFETQERRAALIAAQARDRDLDEAASLGAPDAWRFGTVGAVALDMAGNLTAGTSTGGRTNKRFGRVGDSPIIGAGTYAANESCAVSATGHGEYFMRWTVARDICARVELLGETLADAADAVVIGSLGAVGGDGAVIALDSKGAAVFSMNGAGMYRGVMSSATSARTAVYADEGVR